MNQIAAYSVEYRIWMSCNLMPGPVIHTPLLLKLDQMSIQLQFTLRNTVLPFIYVECLFFLMMHVKCLYSATFDFMSIFFGHSILDDQFCVINQWQYFQFYLCSLCQKFTLPTWVTASHSQGLSDMWQCPVTIGLVQ
jgi:hypothetical protein